MPHLVRKESRSSTFSRACRGRPRQSLMPHRSPGAISNTISRPNPPATPRVTSPMRIRYRHSVAPQEQPTYLLRQSRRTGEAMQPPLIWPMRARSSDADAGAAANVASRPEITGSVRPELLGRRHAAPLRPLGHRLTRRYHPDPLRRGEFRRAPVRQLLDLTPGHPQRTEQHRMR